MITAQRKKETNRQTRKQKSKTKKKKKKTQHKQTMKQTCVHIVLIQGSEKSLMAFAAVSAKLLKTVKCYVKSYFQHRYYGSMLLPFFHIIFKRQMESIAKVIILVFIFILANLQILEAIDA